MLLTLLLSAGAGAQQSGMASGSAQKAEFDAQHRPITEGGFVKSGPIVFENVAEQAGLTKWRNTTGTPQKGVIIEAKGSGVCLLDYDNDGWLDIYLVNGSTFDARSGKTTPPHAALFHNNHDGTFTEVSARAGGGESEPASGRSHFHRRGGQRRDWGTVHLVSAREKVA
jgi:enediyne biosynthesis protein E4